MNPQVLLMCLRAVEEGIMTDNQRAILMDVTRPEQSLADFMELMRACGLGQDAEQLDDMHRYVQSACGDMVSAEPEPPVREALPSVEEGLFERLPSDTQWFCFYALCEGLATPPALQRLLKADIARRDMIQLAQAFLDTGICRDLDAIQRLIAQGAEQARQSDEIPPFDTI